MGDVYKKTLALDSIAGLYRGQASQLPMEPYISVLSTHSLFEHTNVAMFFGRDVVRREVNATMGIFKTKRTIKLMVKVQRAEVFSTINTKIDVLYAKRGLVH